MSGWKSKIAAGFVLGATLGASGMVFAQASAASARPSSGQVSVLPDAVPQQVFAGADRRMAIQLRNESGGVITADLRAVLSQTSSTTVVRISETPWKRLQVLPGQTVVESAALDFPAVKAETRFLIQWVEGASNVVGRTEVLAYPTNLLRELRTLVGENENALGLFDPQNQLKPLLRGLAIEFADLEDVELQCFRGRLAIVEPFSAKKQMREGLPAQIELLAKRGVAVVWLQPPPEERCKLLPSFYAVPVGDASVVVAQSEMVRNLSRNPQSQLNLIHFARLALRPEPLRLPYMTSQQ